MKVTVVQLYGSRLGSAPYMQVRGRVGKDWQCYNVALYHPLAIPRWILVRRSSWAGKYGDGSDLPF